MTTIQNEIELEVKTLLGFIYENDPLYTKCLQEITNSIKERKLLPFLGAGISIPPPSCLPSTDDFINPIKESLWSTVSDIRSFFEKKGAIGKKVNKRAETILNEARMERLLDIFANVYGEEVGLKCLMTLDADKWNFNHESIAILAYKKLLPTCITLNFDILIEKAVEEKNGIWQTFCPLEPITLGEQEQNKADIKVIKPHGSFSMPGETENRFQHIAATLSQAGDLPQKNNQVTLHSALDSSKILLIAGYRDNDWDIFPILQKYCNSVGDQKVIWVSHAGNKAVKSKCTHSLSEIPKVVEWMKHLGPKGIILVGDISNLFADILVQLELTQCVTSEKEKDVLFAEKIESRKYVVENWINGIKKDRLNLLISFASLLECQSERSFLRVLLRKIIREYGHRISDPFFMLSWSLHMEGKYRSAIILRRQGIKVERRSKTPKKSKLSDNFMLLGYHYLCIAKRPEIKTFKGWCNLILNLFWGHFYIIKAIALSRLTEKKEYICSRSLYYIIDYMHSAISVTLFFEKRYHFIARFLHRIIGRLYHFLFKLYPKLRNVEYYWMRELETNLIGKNKQISYDDSIEHLNMIEESCKLTLKQVHIGNVFAYKALLFYEKKNNKTKAKHFLNLAKCHWTGGYDGDWHGSFEKSPSGLRRVALFKRYMGITNEN